MAMTSFENHDVELVDGNRALGSVRGSPSACEKFEDEKVSEFLTLLNKLATHAKTVPKCIPRFNKRGTAPIDVLSRTTPKYHGCF